MSVVSPHSRQRESQSRQADSLRLRHCDLDLHQQRGDTMAYDFSLEGAKWGSSELGTAGGTVTWAVDDSISQTDLQSINAAFAEWSKVADIQFQEVSSTANADIDFSNTAIDGASNVLGVTGFSFSGGQLQHADVQFDSGDNLSGSDLTLVATHEI